MPICSQDYTQPLKAVNESKWMRLALEEGEKGVGLTAPNPSVGAVLVKENKIIGRGYHHGVGKPHAEIKAIADCRAAGFDPTGATAYITLEPCSTTGRTPPCTQALIKNQVNRVVWAADDPNPVHQGAAHEILSSAGLEVESGLLKKEAEYLHRGFFKVQRQGLPWVIVKTAMSLDGRITRPLGEGQWLTGEEARKDVQMIRGEVDAILTSGETARKDNPRLDYRGTRLEKKQPQRLVYSHHSYADLPKHFHLLRNNESGSTQFLKGDLKENLQQLAEKGIQTILVEAGGNFVGQLLDLNLVDEWITYLAPLVTGGDVPAVGGIGITELKDRPRLENLTYQQFGSDIRIRGILKK